MLFKPLVVGVDLDSTVLDLLNPWLGRYNEEYDGNATIADLHTWNIYEHVPIGKEVDKYLEEPHLFRSLEAYPNALEALKRIHDAGHEIHILTAPARDEQTAADKLWWCRQHLPFLDRTAVQLIHQKHRYDCDILIDDAPGHIEKHAARWPNAFRAGIAFPYNAAVAHLMDLRAESYLDPGAAWKQIEEFVFNVATGEIPWRRVAQ